MMTALHSQRNTPLTALCAAMPLPAAQNDDVPEWIHILPAGEFSGADGRGPYRVENAQKLVEASLEAMNGAGVIDENHATDLALPRGDPAPARGWIKEMAARADGIWAKVEWTPTGRALLSEHAYRNISPVIVHAKDGTVLAILRASLVNKPNLRGLTALHQEQDMNELLAQLLAALGLPAETKAETAIERVTALHAAEGEASTSLQSALDPIAKAAGIDAGSDAATVLAGVQRLADAKPGEAGSTVVTALQAELKTVTEQLTSLQSAQATDKATAFVDGAIKAGRVGVKPLRDHYIARHAKDAEAVEKEINSFPILGPSGATIEPPSERKDGEVSLNAAEKEVATMLGLDLKTYAETLKAEREEARA
ncbi:phage protease [Oricola sp.]|uniref:phage protease n=1 Tax=Oricola sp. TaxID=1979950 RepID=UPI0025DAC558|nr:phage protease [Oricola sp.]MCI5075558.1 phage protease [Oricola sp.]